MNSELITLWQNCRSVKTKEHLKSNQQKMKDCHKLKYWFFKIVEDKKPSRENYQEKQEEKA